MSTAAFQEEAVPLLELLAAVSTRLEALVVRAALPPAAAQHAAALRATLLNLSAPGGRRLLAEDEQRWLAGAAQAHRHLAAAAEALKATSEGPILVRAVRDSDKLLTQASEALEPSGPPLALLAGGAAAAFAVAWFLFREQVQVHTEMELTDDEGEGEGLEVEYLPPETAEPAAHREPDEIEDAEFEPA